MVGSNARPHAIVTRAVAAADNYSEFRHIGARNRGHHFSAVFGYAFVFVLFTHHKAGDILQEQQRNFALAA